MRLTYSDSLDPGSLRLSHTATHILLQFRRKSSEFLYFFSHDIILSLRRARGVGTYSSPIAKDPSSALLELEPHFPLSDRGTPALYRVSFGILYSPSQQVGRMLAEAPDTNAPSAPHGGSRDTAPLSLNAQNKDFILRFPQSQLFKTFCEIVGNVLQECYFVVRQAKEPGEFSGIVIESEDREGIDFCVRMPVLQSCLRMVHPQDFLDVWRTKGGTEIFVRVFDPDQQEYAPEHSIKTLSKENDSAKLNGMQYTHLVEIDTGHFKMPVKCARENKVDNMYIEILGSSNNGYEEVRDEETMKESPTKKTRKTSKWFFVMKFAGDELSGRYPFPSCTEEDTSGETGVFRLRAMGTSDAMMPSERETAEMDTLYTGKFSVEYLNLFVKSMERHTLTIRLAQDKPLILEYKLGGGEENKVRFILAPQITEGI